MGAKGIVSVLILHLGLEATQLRMQSSDFKLYNYCLRTFCANNNIEAVARLLFNVFLAVFRIASILKQSLISQLLCPIFTRWDSGIACLALWVCRCSLYMPLPGCSAVVDGLVRTSVSEGRKPGTVADFN